MNSRLGVWDWITPQEAALCADRDLASEALKAGRFWTPNGLLTGRSIDEINAIREQKRGYWNAAHTTDLTRELKVKGEQKRISMSLEPLDPTTGETIRDPQIVEIDPESGEVLQVDQELTGKWYKKLGDLESKFKGASESQEEYSFFLREGPTKIEKETPEPPEGIRNV